MRGYASCGLLLALLLAGCSDSEVTTYIENTSTKFTSVEMMGTVDGCSVKYVTTNDSHPNFYIIRCEDKPKVTTSYYDTGGKNPTRVGGVVEMQEALDSLIPR